MKPSDINPDSLKTGDFVDLLKGANNHNNRLAESGRGNSHTGTIFKPYGNTGPAYIIHNENGPVYVDPLGEFGPTKTWTIMSVRRPGSKEHPYYKEDSANLYYRTTLSLLNRISNDIKEPKIFYDIIV